MSAAIATQMIGADLLKLRKRRGTLAWSLLLVLVPLLLFFIVSAAQHSSNPAEHGPAGGINGYQDAVRILAVIFGPLSAILIGVYSLADGAPTPDAAAMLNGLGFTLLSTAVICAVAVGFSSLTASKPAALVVLIGWQLIASPILTDISSLGSSRQLVLREAIDHFSPVSFGGGRGPGGQSVTLSSTTALLVMAGWLAVFLTLGAWRTRTMDA